MTERIATLTRLHSDAKVTLGRLTAFKDLDRYFDLAVVELPWFWNQPNRSCIPLGKYYAKKHYSERLGHCMLLDYVPGRTEICQHSANFVRELQGCQAPGLTFADIDGDGVIDVASSRKAMTKLNEWAGEGYTLYVTGVAG